MKPGRRLAALLLSVVVLLFGFSLYRDAQRRSAFDSTCLFVDRTIEQHLCNAVELRQRQIGWLEDYDAAMALARKSGRPIFLVSGDGDLCTGRL